MFFSFCFGPQVAFTVLKAVTCETVKLMRVFRFVKYLHGIAKVTTTLIHSNKTSLLTHLPVSSLCLGRFTAATSTPITELAKPLDTTLHFTGLRAVLRLC